MKSIIFIHGFMGVNLKFLAKKMSNYRVYHFSYHSRHYSDATLEELHKLVQSLPSDVAIVAHSMGGLVARNYISQYNSPITSLVTLATPHNQSICAHNASKISRHILGSAGSCGLTIPIKPYTSHIPIGCIAGHTKSLLHLNLGIIYDYKKQPNDGTVFNHEAILANCSDHVIIKSSHMGLTLSTEVANQCLHFIEHHKFK